VSASAPFSNALTRKLGRNIARTSAALAKSSSTTITPLRGLAAGGDPWPCSPANSNLSDVIGRAGGGGGQAKREAAARSWRALDPYTAPMGLYKRFGDRQTQSRPLTRTARPGANLVKLVKYRAVLLGRDPNPCVAH
jgi:hypothetical protein